MKTAASLSSRPTFGESTVDLHPSKMEESTLADLVAVADRRLGSVAGVSFCPQPIPIARTF